MRIPDARWTLSALLFSGSVMAQTLGSSSIVLTSDEAEWTDDLQQAYVGNVRLASDGFELKGERLTLQGEGTREMQVHLEGAPATLFHDGETHDERDEPAPPVSARAEQIDYDGATGYLVGEEMKGLKAMFIMMNEARLAVGIQGLSMADAAYQRAAAWANSGSANLDSDGKMHRLSHSSSCPPP